MTSVTEVRDVTREIAAMLKDMTPDQKIRAQDFIAGVKFGSNIVAGEKRRDQPRKTG